MKVAIASDHAGFHLKTALVRHLQEAGHQVDDLGPASADRVDYPDFAQKVSRAVAAGEVTRGVLVCGSGIGMSMAANRFEGVRAVVAMNIIQAQLSRAHNNANVLCLGERLVGISLAEAILDAFMTSQFEGGRHEGRVAKIDQK